MSKNLQTASDPPRKRHRAPGSAGSSFYTQRNRPLPIPMSEYRERRRAPEAKQAVKLARELTRLAGDFPRFQLALNRLGHHVLLQVRSSAWKTRTVLKYLDQEEATSVKEIMKISGLDFVSVTTTLGELHATELAIPCSRAGTPLLGDQGRSVYWLKK